MSRERLVRGCVWAARIAAAVVALSSGALIVDGALEPLRAREEAAAIEALEARISAEAEVAEPLAAVEEARTERSLARDRRNRILAWILLVSAALFLTAAKGRQTLAGPPPRGLIQIGAHGESVRPVSESVASSIRADDAAPAVDLRFVDEAIRRRGASREATIPLLQALQRHYRYLPDAALVRLCEATEITPAQMLGVATFYAQFRRRPVGRCLVRVCHGTACHVAGIGPIMDELRRQLSIPADADTDAALRFTLESVNCLGCCSLAPVMMVEDRVAGRLTPATAWQELETAGDET